mmetsp:Transcript_13509/g.49142  ORF Transcript_13509/g.49142 Transcript_13509/m.49142 type:complete len:343 (+) Transcript_13509:239-1267(+)
MARATTNQEGANGPTGPGKQLPKGTRIKVWWDLDKVWYKATISEHVEGTNEHLVCYDDGDIEQLNLEKERWRPVSNEEEDADDEQKDDDEPDVQDKDIDDGTEHDEDDNDEGDKADESDEDVQAYEDGDLDYQFEEDEEDEDEDSDDEEEIPLSKRLPAETTKEVYEDGGEDRMRKVPKGRYSKDERGSRPFSIKDIGATPTETQRQATGTAGQDKGHGTKGSKGGATKQSDRMARKSGDARAATRQRAPRDNHPAKALSRLQQGTNNDQSGDKPQSVRTWLESVGLEKYLPCFELHEVTVEVLPMLTRQDLCDMGIPTVGARRRLLMALPTPMQRETGCEP